MGHDSTVAGCDRWQEAISALLDGEDAGIVPTLVDAHLRRCYQCRSYEAQVARLRFLSRLRPVPDGEPGDAGALVRQIRAADRIGKRFCLRVCLVVVAAQILALSLPAMWRPAEGHEGRHVVSFTLTYTLALLLVAWRPARARTVLPVAATLAASLAVTAVFDVARGAATWPAEVTHLPELVSLALVWMLARPPELPRLRHRENPSIRLVAGPGSPAESVGQDRSRSA